MPYCDESIRASPAPSRQERRDDHPADHDTQGGCKGSAIRQTYVEDRAAQKSRGDKGQNQSDRSAFRTV